MAVAAVGLRRAMQACYESVFDPTTWSRALHNLARAADAAGCVAINASNSVAAHRRTAHGPLFLPPSLDLIDASHAYLRDGWDTRDLRTQRLAPIAQPGLVALEQEFSTEDERKRHPYFQEFLRPFELLWWCGVVAEVRGDLWCLTFQRAPHQPPFSREEAAIIASCAPDFARVLAFAEEFGDTQIDMALDAFDLVHRPALLVDWTGSVIRVNAEASAIFDDSFFLRGRRLIAAHEASNGQLQRLLDAAVHRSAAEAGPVQPVTVQRLGQRPLLIEAIPAAGMLKDILRRTAAVLLITDLGAKIRPASEALKASFGLTPAETRLALLMAEGRTVEAVADEMGIVRETARRHLKAVLAKTGTHRQSELAAMLMKLPPGRF